MKIITVEAIMAAGPCPNYPEHRVCELIEGGKTPREIADAEDVPIKDRYWALAMTLPARHQRMLACSVAEWALQRERACGRDPDARSWAAIEVSRRYADGLATNDELAIARRAASDAALNVAWDVAWEVSRCDVVAAAASANASDAAWNAARDAAYGEFCAMAVAQHQEADR